MYACVYVLFWMAYKKTKRVSLSDHHSSSSKEFWCDFRTFYSNWQVCLSLHGALVFYLQLRHATTLVQKISTAFACWGCVEYPMKLRILFCANARLRRTWLPPLHTCWLMSVHARLSSRPSLKYLTLSKIKRLAISDPYSNVDQSPCLLQVKWLLFFWN